VKSRLYGVTSQRIVHFIFTAVRIPDPAEGVFLGCLFFGDCNKMLSSLNTCLESYKGLCTFIKKKGKASPVTGREGP
jgi:hypothetical protein